MPEVWVLVVNWNGSRLLGPCLAAVREAAPGARVLVLDNGSTDDSAAVVATYPDVGWRPLGANLGFAAANDAGLREALAAGARWVALVNPDVRLGRDWLARLVETGERNPHAGLLQGLLVFEDRPDVANSTGLVTDALGRVCDRDFGTPVAALTHGEGPVDGVSGGAALLRADMLRDVGLLDPDYFAYYEDADLSLRARRAGWRAWYVPDARATHGYERSFGAGSPLKTYLLARNHLRIVGAHRPWPLAAALVLALAIARAALRAPAELVRGRPEHAWAHLRGAVAGLAAGASALAWRARGRSIPRGAEVDVPAPVRRSTARRAAGWAAAVAAVLVLGLAAASLPWVPRVRSGEPALLLARAGAGPLEAGASSVALEPAAGAPIAGFPKLDWRSEGERDPVAARALVLAQPGVKIALVSVEILLVPHDLTRAVEERVADLRIDRIVLAATHTHAGPGGYWKQAIAERAGLGPYDRARRDALAARIAEAIRRADGARTPATIASGRTDASHLADNRDDGQVDGHLVSVRVRAAAGDGEIARVVLFPAHPTLLGSANRALSGDWPGELARRSAAPLLYFQGAVGDQSAHLLPRDKRRPDRYAARVATALARVHDGEPEAAPRLAVAVARAVLPPPDLGATPPLLRRAARNALYAAFPERTEVAALRLGSLTLLAVPAEPVAALGERWRAAAGDGAEVLALANDYVGYVETEHEMARGSGETKRTYFGPELAARLEAAARVAAAGVARVVDEAAAKEAGGPEAAQPSPAGAAPPPAVASPSR